MTAAEHYREGFRAYYPIILDEIRTHLANEVVLPSDALAHFDRLIAHCLVGGKLIRGLTVVDAVVAILEAQGTAEVPDDILKRTYAAGWAIEWLQAALLVADDVMDESETRRGQPCWYRMPHVGSKAVNDALLLESQSYFILRKYFRQEKCYADVIEVFHDVCYETKCGQLVDVITAESSESSGIDMAKEPISAQDAVAALDAAEWLTEARRAQMARLKTTYYTYFLPVALALCICNSYSISAACEVRRILTPIGDYFQIQDDYLDVYGDATQLGKVGTDVADGKCAWPVVVALQKASRRSLSPTGEEKSLHDELLQIYSLPKNLRSEPATLARVREIFDFLELPKTYAALEEQRVRDITALVTQIDTTAHPVPPHVYLGLLQKIYRRTK